MNQISTKENSRKSFERKPYGRKTMDRPQLDRTKEAKSTIISLEDGDYFMGDCKILRKAKPGPTIFVVSDGYGSIDAVTKDSPYEVDDIVLVQGPVSERAGRLQIEIEIMHKSDADFSSIISEKSKPVRTHFSISSQRFDKMKEKFVKIAQRIRRAILESQPIMIRHHADADGIISGMCIEHACRAFMEKIGANPDHNLYRSPSKAPFYDTGDVLRDIGLVKRLEDFGQKKPIVLVLDNGSTPEDVFGMKALKMLGIEIIVVDHHNPVVLKDGLTAVCPYVALHLNPYMYGMDGQTCAGMLCYELGRMIWEEFDKPMMPAVAAISDRCTIPETDAYITNSGKDRETLGKMGVAIDFLAYHFRFDPGKGVFEEVFQKPELVGMINDQVRKGVETQLQSTLPYLRTQEIDGVIVSWIDLEKYTLRFTYPTAGKVIGLIHDQVALGKENTPVISLGCVSDMIIIRATKPILPVHKIIENLRKAMPEANVDGGGHECAGTIKFVSAHMGAVLDNIREQIRQLKYMEKE